MKIITPERLALSVVLVALCGCNAITDFDRFGGPADGGPSDGGPSDGGVDARTPDTGPCDDPIEETCNGSDDDCDGMVDEDFSITENPSHCGSCGRVCPPVPNSEPGCADSDCEPVCNTGFGDCDLDYLTGCEASLDDADHCGTCDNACGADELCSAGACVSDCPGTQEVCGRTCVETATDLENCGDCDNVCPTPPNTVPICTTGSCGFTCEPGFADCNVDDADGCEVDVTTTSDCGSCGNVCNYTNGVAMCDATGACVLEACVDGFGDCNGDPSDGCEANLTSTASCGDCSTVCADPANGNATCGASGCDFACDSGFEDCNGDPSDGCEADLAQPATCGACATSCVAPTPLCDVTGCVSGCSAPTPTLCGSSCVDTDTNTMHCGACDAACPVPMNASATCSAGGTCGFTCNPGFMDCNGDPADGCERNVRTLTDCGGCGLPCALDHASESCSTGTCVITACDTGFRDCSGGAANGCETDIRTTSNCGTCGNACTVMNGAPGCTAGACTIASCDAGRDDCDGVYLNGCEEVLTTYRRDADNDTYGNDAVTSPFCMAAVPGGWVSQGGDCNDGNGNVHPMASELCEGSVDHDCDGTIDEGCDCTTGQTRPCGSSVGQCMQGTETCNMGMWSACSGATGPMPETCDGTDQDCDMIVDEGFGCLAGQTQSCTTSCGTLGVRQCNTATCTFGACTPPPEVCDGDDEDCDGRIDEGLWEVVASSVIEPGIFDAADQEADLAFNQETEQFAAAFRTSSPIQVGLAVMRSDLAVVHLASIWEGGNPEVVRIVPVGGDYIAVMNERRGPTWVTLLVDGSWRATWSMLEASDGTMAIDAYSDPATGLTRVAWSDGSEIRFYDLDAAARVVDILSARDGAPAGNTVIDLSLHRQRSEWGLLVEEVGADRVIFRRVDNAGNTRAESSNLLPSGFTSTGNLFRTTRVVVLEGTGPLFSSDRVVALFDEKGPAGIEGQHYVRLDGDARTLEVADLGRGTDRAGLGMNAALQTFIAADGPTLGHMSFGGVLQDRLGAAGRTEPAVLGGRFPTGYYAVSMNNTDHYTVELFGCR